MIEISEEQFLFETENYLNSNFITTFAYDMDDLGDSCASWVKMNTTLASISGSSDYSVTNNITYIAANSSIFPMTTHVTGIGCGGNYSIVKGSEFFIRRYDLYSTDLGIYSPDQEDYIWTANKRDSSGYAFTYKIANTEISNSATMALRITPNNYNASLAEAFGHYAKYTKSVSPSISFDSSGASLSLSPTSSLKTAPNTHVQLR